MGKIVQLNEGEIKSQLGEMVRASVEETLNAMLEEEADRIWEFVRVYTDEGITGTNTKHRDGFKEMIRDALDGKIDLIVTKSVSRFARNTVDSLTTIRQLKERGVEVYFEKEGIYTLDGKGELLITIMSSLAQEESRSISENTTWGRRKRMADGQFSLGFSQFLGYDQGMVINEEEAKVVRLIYSSFMDGMTPIGICHMLEEKGIETPGKKKKWNKKTVESILTNEKYKGDALLQKTFVVDFLTKKSKKNEGEIPQYYVKNSHPPIIPPEEFDRVQEEIARRKSLGGQYSACTVFGCKIVCGDCGGRYGRKVWKSGNRVIWRCNRKYDFNCKTPMIDEHIIKELFMQAYNKIRGTELEQWDKHIWNTLVDSVNISRDGILEFVFKDGNKVRIKDPGNRRRKTKQQ